MRGIACPRSARRSRRTTVRQFRIHRQRLVDVVGLHPAIRPGQRQAVECRSSDSSIRCGQLAPGAGAGAVSVAVCVLVFLNVARRPARRRRRRGLCPCSAVTQPVDGVVTQERPRLRGLTCCSVVELPGIETGTNFALTCRNTGGADAKPHETTSHDLRIREWC